MEKLRLLLHSNCNKNCSDCCNKDWNLNMLPTIKLDKEIRKFNEILLTGGEPLLTPEFTKNVIKQIRRVHRFCRIYVYTAQTTNVLNLLEILDLSDGLTITLHDQNDEIDFLLFETILYHIKKYNVRNTPLKDYSLKKLLKYKSMRLNIFKGVNIDKNSVNEIWQIKDNIEWIKNCPLPNDEIFCKL